MIFVNLLNKKYNLRNYKITYIEFMGSYLNRDKEKTILILGSDQNNIDIVVK